MHEPVGYLPAAGELRFAAALVAAGVTSLDLPALCPAVAAAVLLPYCFGWDTSYRMSWLSSQGAGEEEEGARACDRRGSIPV